MNVLITDATGFIGSHLVKALVSRGHSCRCLVRKALQDRLDRSDQQQIGADLKEVYTFVTRYCDLI